MHEFLVIKKICDSDSVRLWEINSKNAFYAWTLTNAPYFNEFKQLTYEQFVIEEHSFFIDNENVQGIYVDGILIGTVSRYWQDMRTRWMEIGIVIFDDTYWNKGYAVRFLKSWIEMTFNNFELERVGLTTWSGNPGMIRVSKKLGMTQDRTVKYARYFENTYYDSIGFGITRKDWFALNREDVTFDIIEDDSLKSKHCNFILRQLPEWFGIEESTQEYVEHVKDTFFIIATLGNMVIGFISIVTHESTSDEIYVMGVSPQHHRKGIGKSLLLNALIQSKVNDKKMMIVKTLSSKVENTEYEISRRYYESQGFVAIHEDLSIWGNNSPCLIMALPIL